MARQGGRFPQRKPAPVRMASEAITDDDVIQALGENILSEIRGEVAVDSAMQDAQEYMSRRNAIDAEFGLAGLTKQQARDTQNLGSLMEGKVPEAYKASSQQGLEQRIHTTYETNPVTGTQDVVPYMNPGSDSPLVTNYGDSRTQGVSIGGFGKASEYVQDRAMRLMGLNPQRANTQRVTDVDFLVNGYGVDGEIREDFEAKNKNVPIQVYTKVTTPETKGMDKRTVARDVDRVIRDELRTRGGSVIDATERADTGSPARLYDAIPGKLSKTQDMPRILMTTLSSEDAAAGKQSRDKIAFAPKEVRVIDMENAKNYIKGMSASDVLGYREGQPVMQVRPNDGDPNSRNREGRGRVYIRVPESAPGVSYDAAQRFPHVAQLY